MTAPDAVMATRPAAVKLPRTVPPTTTVRGGNIRVCLSLIPYHHDAFNVDEPFESSCQFEVALTDDLALDRKSIADP